MSALQEAERHADLVLGLESEAVRLALAAWGRIAPNAIMETWEQQVPALERELRDVRWHAAFEGASANSFILAEQGIARLPDSFADLDTLVAQTPHGGDVGRALVNPAIKAKSAIETRGVQEALTVGQRALIAVIGTMVADTARQAAQLDLVSKNAGYTRMVVGDSCPACVILAGKFYRWNTGFLRHKNCDCVHIPNAGGSVEAARDAGLVDDPYEYFRGMDEAQQDKWLGEFDAQAVRDGADIFQVVNSKRGRDKFGLFTTEGTTRRGYFRQNNQRFRRRATPELIYRDGARLGRTREETLDILRANGYILPGGQNPKGSIRGQSEGFGQMGGGGRRRRASQAVLDARLTGVRDPSNLYTMTAAERRLADAEWAWREVQLGRNPWTSAAVERRWGMRPVSPDYPLTPEIAASVEAAYRYWIARGGQVYLPN